MVIDWMQTGGSDAPPDPPKVRAAEYVRMSTEHQKYSTDNQAEAIRGYAERRGYEIVQTYADEGKSGLNLGGRLALQRLLNDVESGRADFKALLVYDVSRWGRFQDPDEAATYEYRQPEARRLDCASGLVRRWRILWRQHATPRTGPAHGSCRCREGRRHRRL